MGLGLGFVIHLVYYHVELLELLLEALQRAHLVRVRVRVIRVRARVIRVRVRVRVRVKVGVCSERTRSPRTVQHAQPLSMLITSSATW